MKKNPILIRVVLLILLVAAINFVMIRDLPLFVTSLQIKGKIDGPRHILPFRR